MQRFRLILGKYPVTFAEKRFDGWKFRLQLGGTTTAEFTGVPAIADIRVGDILTLYTEVASNYVKED